MKQAKNGTQKERNGKSSTWNSAICVDWSLPPIPLLLRFLFTFSHLRWAWVCACVCMTLTMTPNQIKIVNFMLLISLKKRAANECSAAKQCHPSIVLHHLSRLVCSSLCVCLCTDWRWWKISEMKLLIWMPILILQIFYHVLKWRDVSDGGGCRSGRCADMIFILRIVSFEEPNLMSTWSTSSQSIRSSSSISVRPTR